MIEQADREALHVVRARVQGPKFTFAVPNGAAYAVHFLYGWSTKERRPRRGVACVVHVTAAPAEYVVAEIRPDMSDIARANYASRHPIYDGVSRWCYMYEGFDYFVGWSLCSRKDAYDVAVGRRLAFANAVQFLPRAHRSGSEGDDALASRSPRHAAWEAFNRQYPMPEVRRPVMLTDRERELVKTCVALRPFNELRDSLVRRLS